MVYETPDTRINQEVNEHAATHTYDSELFGELPVTPSGKSQTDALFLVITDSEFAENRLNVAAKHWRDYGELPDKGQFPYTTYDSEANELVFKGTIFLPDGHESEQLSSR